MTHFVWSNSLLLGAMLLVVGGLKFVGSTSPNGRRIGAGMIVLTSTFLLTSSGLYFNRDDLSLAAIALLSLETLWWWTSRFEHPQQDDIPSQHSD